MILADLYWFQQLDTTKKRFFFSLIGAFLFISNYLNGIAALGAFFAHALLFRRKDLVQVIGPRCRGLAALILPQLLISLPVFFIWNPIGKNVVTQKNSLFDKMELLWRNIRDFNSGGMGCVLLLILGLIIFKNSSQRRFKQYTLLFFSYIALVSFFSPQPVHGTAMADIRYLFPLMVLGLIWTVDFWYQLYPRSKLAFGAGMIFFSFLALPYNGTFQIPLLNLIHELNEPADDPYQVVATWLNENVQPGASIFSSLDFGTYPLMYLAPRFRYFGQFESDFNSTPDYVVSFCNDEVLNRVTAHYTLVKEFGIACREAYRPEYFLRTFGKNQFRGRVAIFRLGQTK